LETKKGLAMSVLWKQEPARSRGVVVAGDTIPRMFWNAVQLRGDRTVLRQKEFGVWEAQSWRELGALVRELSYGLMALGLATGEIAAILSNTRREWAWADLATLCAGGVVNGIYPTDSASQCEFLLADSNSAFVFVEDEEQLDKILAVRRALPALRKIIVFDTRGLTRFSDPQVLDLTQLRELGRVHAAQHPKLFESRRELRQPDDLAILVYTSGTTGRPKGAMISHRNLITIVRGYNDALPQDEGDEHMCFLPLCHIAERVGGEYHTLYCGAVMNFVENPDTVPQNVREIAPTAFLAVPRVWEKLYSGVTIAVREGTFLQQTLYRWGIGVGTAVANRVLAQQPVPAYLKLAFYAARFLVLDNVRKLIGVHRCRFLATGAAPISPDLVRWYLALGVPMCEVWGQTESAGAATITPLHKIKPGSIGPACAHNEVKVSAEGELLIRGDNVFMGYLNQPEKTAETVRDGWLHTGDVGQVDAEGYFKITDRIKDIIITAGGKNVTPSEIENQLKFSPYITDAVVIGDQRPYLCALIMIDLENVEKFAQDNDVPFSNYASLTRTREVQDLVANEVDRVNKALARVEQIKTFRLIEQQLTAEDEELTPTMKLKRKFVQQKYAAIIESMYRTA
jgi:long-chain acyl-CoA synthetase